MGRFPYETTCHLNRAGNLINKEELTRGIKIGNVNKLRRAFQGEEEECAKALGWEKAWNFLFFSF